MEEKITFSEEQLAEIEKLKQEAVAKAVAEKEVELKSQHDNAMAQFRKSNDEKLKKEIEKAKRDATMTADEVAKQKQAEQMERLAFLENEYKKTQLTKKLTDAGVPTMFINDSRLLNSTDENVDEIVETIKTEYSKLIPSGATIDTNIQKSGNSKKKTEQELKFEQFRKIK